jgi:hypothetical protein
MKESHNEGPASHDGPKSCASTREGAGGALTGESTGGILSRENRCSQDADAVELSGRQNTNEAAPQTDQVYSGERSASAG